jgi:hypothetical protein
MQYTKLTHIQSQSQITKSQTQKKYDLVSHRSLQIHLIIKRCLKSANFYSLLHLRTPRNRLRLPNHDMHLNRLRSPLKRNNFLFREVMLLVIPNISLSARFQICCPALKIRSGSHMRYEFLSIAFTASTGLGAKVHEIVRVVVALAHDVMLGVV